MTPDHVEVIDDHPGKKELTLITCDDIEAVNRIIVFADYVKEFPFDTAKKDVKKAFEMRYNLNLLIFKVTKKSPECLLKDARAF
jgi:sortase A